MPERGWIDSYDKLLRPSWLDRKIWSIPRSKNQPPKPVSELGFRDGITIRSLIFWAAAMVVVYVLDRLPLVGSLISLVPWWVVYVTLPFLAAWKLETYRPDGRSALGWMATMGRHYATSPTRSAGRPVRPAGDVSIADDMTAIAHGLDGPRLGSGVVHGPCLVAFAERVNITDKRGGRAVARPACPGRGLVVTDVELSAGERLEVRP